jgi:type II secretory pathway pseudopilin PulG
MRERKGQALIIVVIIIAIVMAVFARSLTTSLRYHSREETEIYQMEQALYIAEMGINQMIFNINNGVVYYNGNEISGDAPSGCIGSHCIGSYKTMYNNTFETSESDGFISEVDPNCTGAYIKSTGTVGVGKISRTIFVSLQSECWPVDAFKYCLFTSTGGSDGVSCFRNTVHTDIYYNETATPPVPVPYPDMMRYKATADDVLPFDFIHNVFSAKNEYANHLVYANMQSSEATLTVDFSEVVSDDVYMSLVTNATSVIVTGLNGRQWYPKEYLSKYPLIVHTGTEGFSFENSSTGFIQLNGFMYTNGYFALPGPGEEEVKNINIIYGEIMEGKPNTSLGGLATRIYYYYDFADVYRPYYFEVIALPGTFREDY